MIDETDDPRAGRFTMTFSNGMTVSFPHVRVDNIDVDCIEWLFARGILPGVFAIVSTVHYIGKGKVIEGGRLPCGHPYLTEGTLQ